MEIGTLWRSSDDRFFKIIDVEITNSGKWVTYINTSTKETFRCLYGAFELRFSQIL